MAGLVWKVYKGLLSMSGLQLGPSVPVHVSSFSVDQIAFFFGAGPLMSLSQNNTGSLLLDPLGQTKSQGKLDSSGEK